MFRFDRLQFQGGVGFEALHKPTRFDRAHFKAFGDSALQFEIVYYVLRAEYAVFMDIQQAINLEINRRFAEQGIEFAYPTQTLYVNTLGSSDDSTGLHSER